MNQIPNSAGFNLPGGKIGVLVLHGFTGSPLSITPWANYLNSLGYTVSAPCLPGHGSSWQQMNKTTWNDWYKAAEQELIELQKKCDRVFIAGFSMGGALALRLCQIRSSEIEGLLLLNPSIHDRRLFLKLTPLLKYFIPSVKKGPTDIAAPNPIRHAYGRTPLKALDSLRKLWQIVERDLYLIDLPIMVAYSINDHAVDPENSMTVIDNIFSVDIREVIFENSYHNVALDYDCDQLNAESKVFIQDVLGGDLKRGSEFNETDLVDAEFDSIVSGLSLDESSPTTYLDELDGIYDAERFIAPNPHRFRLNKNQRLSLVGLTSSLIYLLAYNLTDFEILGLWPVVIGVSASVANLIWDTARKDDDYEDGAKL